MQSMVSRAHTQRPAAAANRLCRDATTQTCSARACQQPDRAAIGLAGGATAKAFCCSAADASLALSTCARTCCNRAPRYSPPTRCERGGTQDTRDVLVACRVRVRVAKDARVVRRRALLFCSPPRKRSAICSRCSSVVPLSRWLAAHLISSEVFYSS